MDGDFSVISYSQVSDSLCSFSPQLLVLENPFKFQNLDPQATIEKEERENHTRGISSLSVCVRARAYLHVKSPYACYMFLSLFVLKNEGLIEADLEWEKMRESSG